MLSGFMVSSIKRSKKSDVDIFEQKIHPLERLIKEKRMPILFIGSGISGRYLDLYTWGPLLERIASVMGINKFQLNGIIKQLEFEHTGSNVYPWLASELSGRMIKAIGEGTLSHDDFPDMSDGDWELMETCNPFKVAVCSILKSGCLTDDGGKLAEIETFRKLSEKIPAVITTNYDDFLEKNVFTDFDTLVYPDEYYFSGSDGYGEILKIHGTVSDPDSIVITAEDYKRLHENSKVIMSRLTYLMCYHPVIFIGYSLRDEEIHEMIFDLVSSLKQTDIDKIRGHLIRVEISEDLHKSKWNPKVVDYDGKRIEVMDLEVPTPEVLYRYLDRFTPIASPSEIKRYKGMIRDIVLSTDPTSKRIALINEDGIDTMGKNCAVLFGDTDSINSIMKGIKGYDIPDVLMDVLIDHKGLLDSSKAAFIEWVSQNRICKGEKFVPIFNFYLKFNIDYRTLVRDIVDFTDNMIARIESKIESMKTRCGSDLTSECIDTFLESQVKSFPRCEALMYFQYAGLINREDCRRRLLKMYNDGQCTDKNGRMKSDIRCAITCLDMKEYMEKINRAEPRTLSH